MAMAQIVALASKSKEAIFRSTSSGLSNGNHEEGNRLFQIGMQHASKYECSKAIEYYTKSIAISPNPAPYINRANLLAKRLRYREAFSDLSEAQRLDQRQGNQFAKELSREIMRALMVSHHYHNGMREQLISDLEESDETSHKNTIAEKIFCASFQIPYFPLFHGRSPRNILEYHFFNDIDNIIKFDEISSYPEVDEFRSLYDPRFIEMKVKHCYDPAAYTIAEIKLHAFLCCYDLTDMQYLRRTMLWNIHEGLLNMDYDVIERYTSLNSSRVIREAEDFAS